MDRQPINPRKIVARPHGIWEPGWFLLTCGDFAAGQSNCMTVSWGSLGEMWNVPFAQVVVRPHRYTFQFIEKYPTFTLCAFAANTRPPLTYSAVNPAGMATKSLNPASPPWLPAR